MRSFALSAARLVRAAQSSLLPCGDPAPFCLARKLLPFLPHPSGVPPGSSSTLQAFPQAFLKISRQWAQTQRPQQLQSRLDVSPASVANAIECALTVSTAASRASASSHTTSRSSGTAQGAGSARRPPRTGTLGCRANADCTTPALEVRRRARAQVDSEAPGLRPTTSRRPACVLTPQRLMHRKR